MKRKTVYITDEQAEWLEKKSINFSKWVRKRLDSEMESEIEFY